MIVLYLAVNFVCLRVLGVAGLHQSSTPASDVMSAAFGPIGARWIEVGITISTLGFLSQGMLTAPRVYYAMARDGMFFKKVGELHPRSHVPVVATVVQGVMAMVIAGWGKYSQILAFSISMDFLFFGLTGLSLFMIRRRDAAAPTAAAPGFRAPGHPWTTGLFAASCLLFVANILYRSRSRPGSASDRARRIAGVRLLALARALARQRVKRGVERSWSGRRI